MTIEVKIPALGESIAEGTLVNWRKKVGDFVNNGEEIVDVETDKVALGIPSPSAGILLEVKKKDGDTVEVGEIIALIDETAQKAQSSAKVAEKVANIAENVVNVADKVEKTVADNLGLALKAINTVIGGGEIDKKASPSARKMADNAGIDTKDIQGSGLGGRVMKADVQRALADLQNNRHEERVPMTRIRQRIAERLLDSKNTTAMLTTFNEVDMSAVMNLRKKYQDNFVNRHGIKLGFMSFFVKAATAALREFPAVNASIDGKDVVYHNYQDIGIAVSSPRGLVVPILRNAEVMDFHQIEAAIKDFSNRAKDGSLSIEEMTGGTFTITNGGTFGSLLSTPILNPPQSAILGMHSINDRPVVVNKEIVIRPMMYLALSYDHRIIDGKEAVSFLVNIKNAIEDPTRLLLDL